jgi:hypothetical protein
LKIDLLLPKKLPQQRFSFSVSKALTPPGNGYLLTGVMSILTARMIADAKSGEQNVLLDAKNLSPNSGNDKIHSISRLQNQSL